MNAGGSNYLQTTYTYAAGSQTLTKASDGVNSTNATSNRVAEMQTDVGIFKYKYDAAGNITEIRYGNSLMCKYTYDGQNQLVREDYNMDPRLNTAYSTYSHTKIFDYDGFGNLLSVKTYDFTLDAPGILQSTKHYAYNNSNWKDQLTGYDGQAITYDAQGNPLSYRGNTIQWQNGRQLKSLTVGSTPTGTAATGTTITYTYDKEGMRQTKTMNGVTTEYYYNENGQLVAQKSGVNVMQFILGSDGDYIGMIYNGTTYYYVKNLQGDVISIQTAANSIGDYTYDAWGNCTVIDAAGKIIEPAADDILSLNPIRYRGYYYDTDTGLYYLQSRYYDAQVGRFLNADEPLLIDISLNLFAYCGNDPVMYL